MKYVTENTPVRYSRFLDLVEEMGRTIPRWPRTQVFPDCYYAVILQLINDHKWMADRIRDQEDLIRRLLEHDRLMDPIPTVWGDM